MSTVVLCSDALGNTGIVCAKGTVRKEESNFMMALPTATFADVATFATRASWLTLIRQRKLFPVKVEEVVRADVEAKVYETPASNQFYGQQMKYRAKYMVNAADCAISELRKFNNGIDGVYYVEGNSAIRGVLLSDGSVKPIGVQNLTVEATQRATNAPLIAFTPVNINETDEQDINVNGVSVDVSTVWSPGLLRGLVNATIAIVGVPTAIELIVDVYAACGYDSTGAVLKSPITGLVKADFENLTAAGAAQTVSTVTESTTIPGRYVFVTVGQVTGTIALVDPNSITDTEALIDGTTPTSFTV